MEKIDKALIFFFIVLMCLTGYTIYNIFNNLAPASEKCEDAIEIINECECFPDEKVAKLFGRESIPRINISLGGLNGS